ncbi:carbohydrate kinase family protein [Angustibacter aerolatus]
MQTPEVLVVGDANPDLVLTGDVVPRFGQAEQLVGAELVMGGSASIAACGLARLGVRTELAAVVGDDVHGRLVRDLLVERGVGVGSLQVHPTLATGLTVVLQPDGGGDRAILTSTGTIDALRADDVEVPAGVRHVHVASYFLQPALAAGLPGLLQRARDAGATTSLDTNWDPAGRWHDVRDVLPLVDVLLPNAAELLAVTGGDDVEQAAEQLLAAGTAVVLKDGARGGRAWTPEGAATVAAEPVQPVDAVGAGDSFDAGWIAARVRGLPVPEALRWAVRCGTLSTRALGGTAAQATPADL